MSIVLSVYSKSAYKEYVLPAVRNAETSIMAEKKFFSLGQNLEILLENLDGEWFFRKSSDYSIRCRGVTEERIQLKDQANYWLKTQSGEDLSIITWIKDSAFVNYRKYDISRMEEIRIGSDSACGVFCTYQYQERQYISHLHAVIQMEKAAAILEDKSKNGIFVNDERVIGKRQLEFGDHIHIWSVDMVYLGSVLAIRMGDNVKVQDPRMLLWNEPSMLPAEKQIEEEQKIYHRAPRKIEILETDAVEIEAPPAPKEPSDTPFFMAVGPAMTMAIPMVMSSVIAVIGARSTGAQASTFMYTGIITSISSALIGAGWAINNIRYGKKKAKKEENHRFEAYGEYLIKCADQIKEKYNHNAQALLNMYPSAEMCVSGSMERGNTLWGRNSTHGDFLQHRLGLGDCPFQVPIQIPKEKFTLINDSLADRPQFIQDSYRTLHQVPICLNLLEERLIGVIGGADKEGTYQIVYSLVAQIAAQNCYTDVKMAFSFQEQSELEGRWEFARWLPHVWSPDKKVRYVAGNRNEASDLFYELTKILRFRSEELNSTSNKKKSYKPYYILFVEEQSYLEGELLSKYIFDEENDLGFTVVLMAERHEDLPNACECVIQNDSAFQGKYNTQTGERTAIAFDVMNQSMLERMVRRLSGLEVNETEVGGDIPNAITFFDMYGVSSLDEFHVEERWKKNRTYENMRALVGQRVGGAPCYLDVHEKYHGPHGLVAGTTGSGKSETLQTYMLSLAINFSPDDIGFFIIDYKGGGMANLFNGLPHLLGQISNLSGNQVRRAMVSIKSENKRRQRIFNEHGVNNINAYTTLYKNGEAKQPVPHMFIIIDEFAELKREEGDFMKELISVAQVGRSLGVHLILATQKPSGTVDDNIWSNSKFRLCLRVQDRQDSIDMLHKPDAAYLTQAGRCYLQVGNDELYELFQSGWSGAVYDEDAQNSQQVLAVMLNNAGRAALVGGHVKRRRKEDAKRKWLKQLCEYLDRCMAQWELSSMNRLNEGETRGQFLERGMYAAFQKEGIDFAVNEYNSHSLQNLIQLYDDAKKQNVLSCEDYILNLSELGGVKLPEMKEKSQLDAIISYLADVALREGYQKPQQLWLPVLPCELYLTQLDGYNTEIFAGDQWPKYPERWELKTMIGLCDDPMQQAQMPLEINFTESGHHAVCGIAMSGKSTFLQSVVYSLIHRYSPEYLNLYLLDFSSRMLGAFEGEVHVGGVLYESDLDTIGKFFHMVEQMIQERKQQFRGGNYNQYVMTYGVKYPAVLIVIDNVAGFREKTEFKYDDVLVQMTRESAAYGIYFLVSGAGFNTSEIPIRMRDNLHRIICLEMLDRFQYSDCLGIMQLSVLPEPGIHGRGLAVVNGEALEFQTALSLEAPDDYKRGEEIKRECERLNRAYDGRRARQIPRIPEKPEWPEFAELDMVRSLVEDDRSLPIGYDVETADIYSIDLFRNYCYLISGKSRTGKTNLLKVLMLSGQRRKAELVVVEFGGAELKRFSDSLHARYIDSYQDYMTFMADFILVFKERNQIKKQCLAQGMEEGEIYERMSREKPYFIFLADLVTFTLEAHGPKGAQDNLCGAMTNLFDKGFLHNIYFFACMNQDKRMDVIGKEVYETFVRARAGIHLGGNVAAQRLFEFGGMPYTEQSAVEKPGIGAVPPGDSGTYHKVIIPLVKGQTVS